MALAASPIHFLRSKSALEETNDQETDDVFMAYRMSCAYLLHQRELGGNRAQANFRSHCFASQVYESNTDVQHSDDSEEEKLPLSVAFSQEFSFSEFVLGPISVSAVQLQDIQSASSSGHNLAVGFEDGSIAIDNTHSILPTGNPGSIWRGHENAIFDVVWSKDVPVCAFIDFLNKSGFFEDDLVLQMDTRILTASGDQTVKAWDVCSQQEVASCKGHKNSVKTISVQPFAEANSYAYGTWRHADCFASGGRDGTVKLWDIRALCGTSARSCKPCGELKDVHVQAGRQPLRRRRVSVQGSSNQSVTSVLYLKDGNLLATAGAADGVVKFWDLRALKVPVVKSPQLETSDSESRVQERSHGITSLSQDDRGRHLAASCTNGSIYLLNPLNLESTELPQFKGHDVGSFYVKAKLSPDGNSIVSGSSDSGMYIWQVSHPEASPTVLRDHFSEVTAVDWCPSNLYKIATCSDDSTVRVWTPNHLKERNGTQPWLTLHGNGNRKRRTCQRGAAQNLTFESEMEQSHEELKTYDLSSSQTATGKRDGTAKQEMEEKEREKDMSMLPVDVNKPILSSSNLCGKRVRALQVEEDKDERKKRGQSSGEKMRTIKDYFVFQNEVNSDM